MPKAIKVMDTDSGTESWEELDSFFLKENAGKPGEVAMLDEKGMIPEKNITGVKV